MEVCSVENINNYGFRPSFEGVTGKLSKTIYSYPQIELKEYLNQRGDKNSIVGKLPGFIIEKLDKQHLPEAIKEIMDTFAEAARDLGEFKIGPNATIKEIMYGRSQKAVDKLKAVLVKYKILSKYDNFDLEYLGKGGKGSVYKLSGLIDSHHVDEDEFVIKVFHVKDINRTYDDIYRHHGIWAEMNVAAYWMKHLGYDTNRGKFFFGDIKNGYMITKFVDEDVRVPHRYIISKNLGLEFTDEDLKTGQNCVKGYSYDWGGCCKNDDYQDIHDKVLRDTFNRIKTVPAKNRLARWFEMFNSKGNSESEYAGLAKCIPYLPKESQLALVKKCEDLNSDKVNRVLASCGFSV